MNYTFKWKLEEQGWKQLQIEEIFDNTLYKPKAIYTNTYLSDSIKHAQTGWNHCVYHVFKDKNDNLHEYVGLYASEDAMDGRLFNITGNSLAAIGHTVWNGIY